MLAAMLTLLALVQAVTGTEQQNHCSNSGLPIRCVRTASGTKAQLCGGRTEHTAWILRKHTSKGAQHTGREYKGRIRAAELVARVRAQHCAFLSRPSYAVGLMVAGRIVSPAASSTVYSHTGQPSTGQRQRRRRWSRQQQQQQQQQQQRGADILAAASASLVVARPSKAGFDVVVRHASLSSTELIATARRGSWQISWVAATGAGTGETVEGTSGWDGASGSDRGAIAIDVSTNFSQRGEYSNDVDAVGTAGDERIVPSAVDEAAVQVPLYFPALVMHQRAHFPHSLVPSGMHVVLDASPRGFRLLLVVEENTAAAVADTSVEAAVIAGKIGAKSSLSAAVFEEAGLSAAADVRMRAAQLEHWGWTVSWLTVQTPASSSLPNSHWDTSWSASHWWRVTADAGAGLSGSAWVVDAERELRIRQGPKEGASIPMKRRAVTQDPQLQMPTLPVRMASLSRNRTGSDTHGGAHWHVECDFAAMGGCRATSAPALVAVLYGGSHARPTGSRGELRGGGTMFEPTAEGFLTLLPRMHSQWAQKEAKAEVGSTYMRKGAKVVDSAKANAVALTTARAAALADARWLRTYRWRVAYLGYDGEWPADCVMGMWGAWTQCTTVCGTGTQQRSREIIQSARGGGLGCGATSLARACNTKHCTVDCIASRWGAWHAAEYRTTKDTRAHRRHFEGRKNLCFDDIFKGVCTPTTQVRLRRILVRARYGGKPCGVMHQKRACARSCNDRVLRDGLSRRCGGMWGGHANDVFVWHTLGSWAITTTVNTTQACDKFARDGHTPQYSFDVGRKMDATWKRYGASPPRLRDVLFGVGVVFAPSPSGFRVILDGRGLVGSDHFDGAQSGNRAANLKVNVSETLLARAKREMWTIQWVAGGGAGVGCTAQHHTGWSAAPRTANAAAGTICTTIGGATGEAAANGGTVILPALQVPLPPGALEHSDTLRRDQCSWCVFGPRFVAATTMLRASTPRDVETGFQYKWGVDHAKNQERSSSTGHKQAILVCVLPAGMQQGIANVITSRRAEHRRWSVSWMTLSVSFNSSSRAVAINGDGVPCNMTQAIDSIVAVAAEFRLPHAARRTLLLPHCGSDPAERAAKVMIPSKAPKSLQKTMPPPVSVAHSTTAGSGNCPAGKYALEATLAIPGMLAELPTSLTSFQLQCVLCPVGRFSAHSGAVADVVPELSSLESDTMFAEGATRVRVVGCQECPTGKWQHAKGQHECDTAAPTPAPSLAPSPWSPPAWMTAGVTGAATPIVANTVSDRSGNSGAAATVSVRAHAEAAAFQAERAVIAHESGLPQYHKMPVTQQPGHGATVVPVVAGLTLLLVTLALRLRQYCHKLYTPPNTELDDMLDGIEAANAHVRMSAFVPGEHKFLIGGSLDAEQLATRGPV